MENIYNSKLTSGSPIKSILVFLILLFYVFINTAKADWELVTNGMGNPGGIYSLAFKDGALYCGTQNQVLYKSTNSASSWTFVPFTGGAEMSILVNGNTIFIGTEFNGVYLSTDNGASWQQTSLNNRRIFSLAAIGNTIIAGTDSNGIYRSTDNGISWMQTSLTSLSVRSFLVNGNTIFAGTENRGIYRSTDNGTSWSQTTLIKLNIRSFAVDGGIIFAGTTTNDMLMSSDNGLTWTNRYISGHGIWALAVTPPIFGNFIFAGTGGGTNDAICVSSDNGVTWVTRSEGLSGVNVGVLCIAGNYVFAGTGGWGVYRRLLSEITGVSQISSQIPEKYSLAQNYPNPFNPSTTIEFSIPKASDVKLVIYDILGSKVDELVNSHLNPGTYKIAWDAAKFSSGTYFYRLEAGEFSSTGRMILTK